MKRINYFDNAKTSKFAPSKFDSLAFRGFAPGALNREEVEEQRELKSLA